MTKNWQDDACSEDDYETYKKLQGNGKSERDHVFHVPSFGFCHIFKLVSKVVESILVTFAHAGFRWLELGIG